MSTAQEVHNRVMALSASERASLAHDLILSLEDSRDFDLSPQEESEIQRRLMLVREGKATGKSPAEVFAAIKAHYP